MTNKTSGNNLSIGGDLCKMEEKNLEDIFRTSKSEYCKNISEALISETSLRILRLLTDDLKQKYSIAIIFPEYTINDVLDTMEISKVIENTYKNIFKNNLYVSKKEIDELLWVLTFEDNLNKLQEILNKISIQHSKENSEFIKSLSGKNSLYDAKNIVSGILYLIENYKNVLDLPDIEKNTNLENLENGLFYYETSRNQYKLVDNKGDKLWIEDILFDSKIKQIDTNLYFSTIDGVGILFKISGNNFEEDILLKEEGILSIEKINIENLNNNFFQQNYSNGNKKVLKIDSRGVVKNIDLNGKITFGNDIVIYELLDDENFNIKIYNHDLDLILDTIGNEICTFDTEKKEIKVLLTIRKKISDYRIHNNNYILLSHENDGYDHDFLINEDKIYKLKKIFFSSAGRIFKKGFFFERQISEKLSLFTSSFDELKDYLEEIEVGSKI